MARVLTLTLNPALDLTLRLDSLALGSVNRSLETALHVGGKGLNVAQVLADLGHQLSVSGFLGETNAAAFEQLFQQRGFTDGFVRVPGETRSNIKLAEVSGRITDINGPGLQVSVEQQRQLLSQLDKIVPGQDAVVVAGSLPRGVSADWFGELIARLTAFGLPVLLDSSGDALRAGLAARPWLVKPNEEELAEACGLANVTAEALDSAALALRTRGIEHLLLSCGADGALWYGPHGVLHGQPPQVEVSSTVGAGDSLLAATLHGLLSGWSAERTLRLATAVAAQAVTQIGFGIQDRQQLARLEAEVTVVSKNN